MNNKGSYVPDRLDNGRPSFGGFDPVTVNPYSPPSPTPYEPIRVPIPSDPSNLIRQPNLTSADLPASRPSPAVKPGR
jgi:hypothetical protein